MLIIKSQNDNCNKIKTKEELLELLTEYKGILTSPILNYLNSLIELEFSVIKEYISDSDRKVLAELEIYKNVAIYNIYNRVQNLFNNQNEEFIISGNNEGLEGLRVSTKLNDRCVKLFDFDYKEIHSNIYETSKVQSDFKTLNVGNISLFQTFENKELREAELDRVMKKLEILYDEKNPYQSHFDVVGGPESTWAFEHFKKIQAYEERFKQLDSKKELSDEDKKEIEITKKIHDLLLEDFGLTNESFVEENNQPFSKEKTHLNKTLVRRMPNLTIKDNKRYI